MPSAQGKLTAYLIAGAGLVLCGLQGHAERLQGSVVLVPGLNLIGLPVNSVRVPDFAALLSELGTPDTVAGLTRLNPATGLVEQCAFDVDGNPIGAACTATVASNEGSWVEALTAATIPFDAILDCPSYTLSPGLNVVAFPCAATGLSSFRLLETLGDPTVIGSVQHLDPETGRWVATVYQYDLSAGGDFPILPGHAYLVGMLRESSLAPPLADAGPDQIVRLPPAEGVRLDATNSSDPDTATASLGFRWTLQVPAGSAAALDDPNSVTPSLTPDVMARYVVTLTVADGVSQSTDEVEIIAVDPSIGPDADFDGLGEQAEAVLGTDPLLVDSDGDGFPDGMEVDAGSNPADANRVPKLQVGFAGVGRSVSVVNRTVPTSERGFAVSSRPVSIVNTTIPIAEVGFAVSGRPVSVVNETTPTPEVGFAAGRGVSVLNGTP